MADIQLRFDKDALVLSGPVQSELMQLGTDMRRDAELTMLLEPEVFEDAYKMQQFAGAQCFVANTAGLTPARLSQAGMRDQSAQLARVALDVVNVFNPQHVLIEVAPCGLPLDASSRQSLNENCDQYKRAAKLFENLQFDAFFLNGFAKCADLKCALMGIRKVSDAPIFASVDVDGAGTLVASEWSQAVPGGESLEDAVQVMAEYGAQVVGFSTGAPAEQAAALAERIRKVTFLPMLAQLDVAEDVSRAAADAKAAEIAAGSMSDISEEAASEYAPVEPSEANPYPSPDSMLSAADALYEAGVQFFRASGNATPAYTGALVAATEGRDAILTSSAFTANSGTIDEPMEDVAARLRQKVSAAIKKQA